MSRYGLSYRDQKHNAHKRAQAAQAASVLRDMSGAELMTHARFELAHDVDPTAANKYRMGRADEVMPPGYVPWRTDELPPYANEES